MCDFVCSRCSTKTKRWKIQADGEVDKVLWQNPREQTEFSSGGGDINSFGENNTLRMSRNQAGIRQ